jgi:putative heme-binding domain-containing protein
MRSLALLALLASPALAQPPVAPTDARSPADELKSFKLPPGFAAQLVASEPDIQKPMQHTFDAKGRLWVTTSYHYPFAAEPGKAADKLFVLSDIGDDGKAKKVEVFYDKLNIPIGILPLPDCKSCIVSSVGEILKLTDTDGDGKADKREVLFAGFGTRDTHGMTNSFTHMPDGWVYACHGFANDSKVKGTDGHEIQMNSGHTFRFRPDGSRIEVYTRGQVNPFGMAVDPWFNLYTADCHSKPITQLIKGAYYDSFGKPHDGLGYAPHVTRHDHGSTGLCGLTWYDADHFPKEWAGCMFLGNVVTSRINADRIEWKGSTPVAKELPDFLVSSDPWFRPTDIKLGPDGALYVTDFYNKIVGHYEVDLKHPQRDKTHGRVWRIVATAGGAPKMPFADLTKEKMDRLVDLAYSKNITTRLLAVLQINSRLKSEPKSLLELMPVFERQGNMIEAKPVLLRQFVVSWCEIAELAGANTMVDLAGMSSVYSIAVNPLEVDPAGIIDVHGLRALADYPPNRFGEDIYDKVHKHLSFKNARSPVIARAAVDLIAARPHHQSILPLAKFIPSIPNEDIGLRHAARVALRNTLATDESQAQLVWLLKDSVKSGEPAAKDLDDVFLGVPTAYAGWWLSERLKAGTLDAAFAERAYQHVGRYGCDCHRQIAWLAAQGVKDTNSQVAMLQALKRGIETAGATFKPSEAALLVKKTREGLISPDDATVVQSFQLATAIGFDVVGASINLGPNPFKDGTGNDFDVMKVAYDHLRNVKRSEAVRMAAFTAIEKLPKEQILPVCSEILADTTSPIAVREKAISILVTSTKLLDQIALTEQLKTAPYRQCVTIATGLAGSKAGAEQLLAAVRGGKGSARLLQEKTVLDRLKATDAPNWQAAVKELTAGLPSADARLAALIKQRGDGYRKAKIDPDAGKKVFATTCANCHQIGGQGAKVGPQLDGIGNRGIERLLEDVLDPNRNVDHAFHTTTLELNDGRQLSGLLRVEGQVLILIDPQAKETRVSADDVDKKRTSPLSPMPSDIAEKLKPQDFYDLIGYLAGQKAK